MKSRPYKNIHTAAEKEYFKEIADKVRAKREAATAADPAKECKGKES